MRYLDPKNDLTFKKIFGEHPDLLISLLNALMPFEENQYIETLEYLPPELTPVIPEFKNSIVDVRCMDNRGRQFIVEMQMLWTPNFKYRVIFNASKAFIKQLDKGRKYESLQPVYALNLINDKYIENDPDFYHHYSIVNAEKPENKLEGLEFIFIELPKYKPQNLSEKKMATLWLRFLTEIEDGNESVAADLKTSKEIQKALEILNESAFTKAELEMYDRYWDAISKERTYAHGQAEIAEKRGLEKGFKKGIEQGIEQGMQLEKETNVINFFKAGVDISIIAHATGLTTDQINEILKKYNLI